MSEACFKDSGIEWIGKIPKHWEIWKLKYLARAYTGNSIKDDEKDFYTDPQDAIPYIATKDICRETQKCDYNNGLYIHNSNKNFKRAKKHSTLLCIEGGSAGKKLTYLNTDVCFVNKLCCIEALKGFNGKWLFYFLQSREFLTEFGLRLNGLIGGVSLEKFKRFYIPLPPLQEQEAIAHYLDEKTQTIDELISAHQKSIEKLKDYRTSLISEVVTQGLDKNAKLKDSGIEWIGKIPKHWEIGKVKHYYQIATGFTPSSDNETFYDDENGHIWITISDLKEKFIADSFSKISQFYIDQYKPKTIPKNSLLYSFKLSVGAVAFNKVDVFTNEAIASFFDNDKISLPFLYYSSRFIVFNANENIYGAKILNQNLIKNAKIVFPPLQEQEAIARYLDEKTQAIDELISAHQKSIEKLKDYRTSLISEVVTGKKNLQGIDNGN